jgi:cardiolipin synthase (CMP-forming)
MLAMSSLVTPNALTLLRVGAIPLVVAAYFLPPAYGGWLMWGLFLVASITDFFDGWLARRLGLTSAFGAMLDPIADKLLVVTVLFLLARSGWLGTGGLLAAIVIVLRELFIAGLREFAAGKCGSFPVSFLAKLKTTTQLMALSLSLFAFARGEMDLWWWLGEALLMLAALLTAWTGWQYWVGVKRQGVLA